MSTESRVLSLLGRNLKLDTRLDIEPYLKQIDVDTTEEIHLSGNTIGVEAAEALGEVLKTMKTLKVNYRFYLFQTTLLMWRNRSRTSQIYSLVD